MQKFGLVSNEEEKAIASCFRPSGTLYAAVMDRESLWEPATIDRILKSFPAGHIEEADLFLILAECIANAVQHGQARVLGLYARRRGPIMLISFHQIPSMPFSVKTALLLARDRKPKEGLEEIPGGLGFPILLRLVGKITLSCDLTRLRVWVKCKG